MSKLPCTTCVEHGRCNRTVGKQGERYICGDYNPVKCCTNCKYDGQQLVARECIDCNIGTDCLNFELRT